MNIIEMNFIHVYPFSLPLGKQQWDETPLDNRGMWHYAKILNEQPWILTLYIHIELYIDQWHGLWPNLINLIRVN